MQGVQKHVRRSQTIQNLISALVFNNTTTTDNSVQVDTDNEENFTLYLDIDSTLTPTDIQFIPQFSNDNGTTWFDYKQDQFVALFYEDVNTASGLTECLSGKCVGRDFRLRTVATGTDATNFFTVSVDVEFWS